MTPENEEGLRARFPVLLAHLPYFECGDGWFGLIEEALVEAGRRELPGTSLGQAKEKFGGLRLNFDLGDDVSQADFESFHAFMGTLEVRSRSVCEVCGEPGETRRSRAWVQTLCADHAKPATPGKA